MPNYNKDLYLEESLNSIILQKYKNWNLIVIDDFSNDNSKKILEKFKKKNKNIDVIYLQRNKGVAYARNLGLRLARGKYISFLDSDDYWHKDKLFDQINFMEDFNYVFTYTDYIPFNLVNNQKIFKKKIETPNSLNFNAYINDTSIATSSMIVNREFVGLIKCAKVRILEDYSFKCKLLKKGCTAVRYKKELMHYRIVKKSLSSSKFQNLYWLFLINFKYNKLSIFQCIKSLFFISISSMRKYGFK